MRTLKKMGLQLEMTIGAPLPLSLWSKRLFLSSSDDREIRHGDRELMAFLM
jgi:hypothetical protein